jgi:hypothetical protein
MNNYSNYLKITDPNFQNNLSLEYYFTDYLKTKTYNKFIILSILDILDQYDVQYMRERLIQQDIVSFLNLKRKNIDYAQIISIIWLKRNKNIIPQILNVTNQELDNFQLKLESFEDIKIQSKLELPYCGNSDDVYEISDHLKDSNTIMCEYKNEISLLTKYPCHNLFFGDLNHNMYIMKYNNSYRLSGDLDSDPIVNQRKTMFIKYTTKDCLEMLFFCKLGKNKHSICRCRSKNYLTKFEFKDHWPEPKQIELINLFNRCNIVAVVKNNIQFSFDLTIPKYYLPIVRDVMFSGSMNHYFIFRELDTPLEEKNKDTFVMGRCKFNFVKITEQLTVKTNDRINEISDYYYFCYIFINLRKEFVSKRDDIISLYEANIIQTKKTKQSYITKPKDTTKTKKILNKLRTLEPKLFGGYVTKDGTKKSYATECQYKKQPYVVENVDEFKNILLEYLEDFEDEAYDGYIETIDDYLEYLEVKMKLPRKITFEDLYLEYEDDRTVQKRIYVCIPRAMKEKDYVFPLIQEKSQAPCCFKVPERNNVSAINNTAYILGISKTIKAGKSADVPNYLGELINSTTLKSGFYRFGLTNFEQLLKFTSNTESLKLLENNKKYLDTQSYNSMKSLLEKSYSNKEELIRYTKLISYLLKKNIVTYDKVPKYNASLIVINTWNVKFPYSTFILFSDINEEPEFIRSKNHVNHKDNKLSEYLEFYEKFIEKEKVILK